MTIITIMRTDTDQALPTTAVSEDSYASQNDSRQELQPITTKARQSTSQPAD